MSPATILETDRLRLREWTKKDVRPYARHCNTLLVMRWLGDVRGDNELLEDVDWFIDNQKRDGFTFWVMERKEDKAFLGFCGLIRVRDDDCPIHGELEIGWRVRADLWRKGYSYEAASQVLKFAFDVLRTMEVFSRVAPANVASRGLMEKLGMRERRDLCHLPPGETEKLRVYAIAYSAC